MWVTLGKQGVATTASQGNFLQLGSIPAGQLLPPGTQESTKRARPGCVAPIRKNNQERKGAQALTSKRACQFRNSSFFKAFAERERAEEGHFQGRTELSPWPSGKREGPRKPCKLSTQASISLRMGVFVEAALENETY